MKKTLFYILRFLVSLALVITFALLGLLTKNQTVKICLIIISIITCLPAFFTVIKNFVLAKKLKNEVENLKIKEFYEKMENERENIESTLNSSLEKITKAKKELIFAVFTYVAFICSIILLISLTVSEALTPFAILGTGSIFVLLCYVIYPSTSTSKSDTGIETYESENDFPEIYAIIKKAQNTVGVKKKIYFNFNVGDNIRILDTKNAHVLDIGVQFISILTPQEFEQIMLHEFTHTLRIYDVKSTDEDFYNAINSDNFMLSYYIQAFVKEFETFKYASSLLQEKSADSSIISLGDKKICASALTKTGYFELFEHQFDHLYDIPLEGETPQENFFEMRVEKFWEKLSENKELWDEIIKNEIEPKNATHPLTRHRVESLGETNFEILTVDQKSPFNKEVKKALLACQKEYILNITPSFKQFKDTQYKEYFEKVTKWRENGKNYEPLNFNEIAYCLNELMCHNELIELCEKVLEQTEISFHKAVARFYLGKYAFFNLDKKALEHFYSYIDIVGKSYAMTDAISYIGLLCCKLGLEKELEEYRSLSMKISQEILDFPQDYYIYERKGNYVKPTYSEEFVISFKNYAKTLGYNNFELYTYDKLTKDGKTLNCFFIKPTKKGNTFKNSDINNLNAFIYTTKECKKGLVFVDYMQIPIQNNFIKKHAVKLI